MLFKKTTHIIPILGLLLCTAQIQTYQNIEPIEAHRENDEFLTRVNGLLINTMEAETGPKLSKANHALEELFKNNPEQTNLLLRYHKDERAPYTRAFLQMFNLLLDQIEEPTTIETLQKFGFMSTYDPSKITGNEQELLNQILERLNQSFTSMLLLITGINKNTLDKLSSKLNSSNINPLLNVEYLNADTIPHYYQLMHFGLITREALYNFFNENNFTTDAELLRADILRAQENFE